MKKIFGLTILATICYLTIVLVVNAYDFCKLVLNQENQMVELLDNQALLNDDLDYLTGKYLELYLETIDQKNNLLKINEYNSNSFEALNTDTSSLKKEIVSLKSKVSNLKEEVKNEYPSYNYLRKRIVYISNMSNPLTTTYGTGVVIKKEEEKVYILTNKHICDKLTSKCIVMIYRHNNYEPITLSFVKQSENNYDLSLWVSTENIPFKKPINGVSDSKIQNKVYSVGNYLAVPYIYTEGTFAGYTGKDYVFNLPCAFGCSGSGVFDKNGNLISIIYSMDRVSPLQVDTSKVRGIRTDIIKLFLKDIL